MIIINYKGTCLYMYVYALKNKKCILLITMKNFLESKNRIS